MHLSGTVHISVLRLPREDYFARDRRVVVQIQDIRICFHMFVYRSSFATVLFTLFLT
jgi:hypothetical protein